MNRQLHSCGKSFTTQMDIGFDIDPSGEERQHLDTCECGATRLWVDRIENFTHHKQYAGKWVEKADSPLWR